MFRDRTDAAEQLATRLGHLTGTRPLILGIPRGGVPMAAAVADALDGELDVVLVHKLGAPGNPEYAIGAVSEDGTTDLSEDARRHLGADYVDAEVSAQLDALRGRRRRYTPVRPPVDPAERTVVIVDDGSATGATMAAALRAVRRRKPARLVAALAVAPPEAVETLDALADEVVCLATPGDFMAVGQYFRDFGQVSDDAVIRCLAGRAGPPCTGGAD